MVVSLDATLFFGLGVCCVFFLKQQVLKFVFEKDRKLAMGSRLLQRYAVREV